MTSWIFQSNPQKFRIDDYLYDHDYFKFTIRQKRYKDEISLGDEVYIWRSNGNKPKSGGIIAKGKILSHPKELMDDAPEYWKIEKDEPYGFELRVEIKLEDLRRTKEEGMLLRVDLMENDNVNDMTILTQWQGTNYKLESEQSKHIDDLWESKKDKSTFYL